MFTERSKSHHTSHRIMRQFMKDRMDVKEYLKSLGGKNENGAIYIHVPFCNKICSFCNMRRSLSSPVRDYAELVVKEIEAYRSLEYIRNSTFQSVYFGGGTPTTLDEYSLEKILNALKENLQLTEDAEISFETTVTELSESKLETLKKCGVNRFSVGIQTFNDEGRKLFARKGSGENAYNKLIQMKRFGLQNVNMDLIYNYPNQTVMDLEEDLEKIFSLNLGGFSFYSLIAMNDSALKQKDLREKDMDFEFFNKIYEKALENKFSVLEITKLAKHDDYRYIRARHNGADTLALGAGAGGGFSNILYGNPLSIEEYRHYVENFNNEKLIGTVTDSRYKAIIRFIGEIQQCKIHVDNHIGIIENETLKLLEKLEIQGYLERIADAYVMTKKGIYWGNSICETLTKTLNIC